MQIKCGDDCFDICDFCVYLERYNDDFAIGGGKCMLHDKKVEWTDSCDHFVCINTEDQGD
jgi:hypothetical protein